MNWKRRALLRRRDVFLCYVKNVRKKNDYEAATKAVL